MRAVLLFAFLAAPGFSWAISTQFPTININGVNHYLADADDVSGEWFDTVLGFCATQNLNFTSAASTIDASLAPLVILDQHGQILETLPNNKSNQIWVVTDITCD